LDRLRGSQRLSVAFRRYLGGIGTLQALRRSERLSVALMAARLVLATRCDPSRVESSVESSVDPDHPTTNGRTPVRANTRSGEHLFGSNISATRTPLGELCVGPIGFFEIDYSDCRLVGGWFGCVGGRGGLL
jgi:hypothetical protein